MKVGIVTFQCADNYGAILQCYALFRYLKDAGCDVEVIDYQNQLIQRRYTIFPKLRKNLLQIAKPACFSLRHYQQLKKRQEQFAAFRVKIQMSEAVTRQTLETIASRYDVIISGSDQLWNPHITNGFDPCYFLHVAGEFKRATYAMSMGNIQDKAFQQEQFDQWIGQFDEISMREHDAAVFVGEKLHREIEAVVDPTLLLSAETWYDLAKQVQHPGMPERYVFLYYVKYDPDLVRMAEHIANAEKIPLVFLNIRREEPPKTSCERIVLHDAGPLDFVSLIAHAEHVVTSSFHGTAFSCIFRKDIYLLLPQETGARVRTIVDLFSIGNRVYRSYDHFVQDSKDGFGTLVYQTEHFDQAYQKSVAYLERVIEPKKKG